MNIGIEGEGEKCWIVVQFDSGERAVKGPMPEDEAQQWIDGIIAGMDEEGFGGATARTVTGTGSQLPQAAVWIGSVVTFAFLLWFMVWALR